MGSALNARSVRLGRNTITRQGYRSWFSITLREETVPIKIRYYFAYGENLTQNVRYSPCSNIQLTTPRPFPRDTLRKNVEKSKMTLEGASGYEHHNSNGLKSFTKFSQLD